MSFINPFAPRVQQPLLSQNNGPEGGPRPENLSHPSVDAFQPAGVQSASQAGAISPEVETRISLQIASEAVSAAEALGGTARNIPPAAADPLRGTMLVDLQQQLRAAGASADPNTRSVLEIAANRLDSFITRREGVSGMEALTKDSQYDEALKQVRTTLAGIQTKGGATTISPAALAREGRALDAGKETVKEVSAIHGRVVSEMDRLSRAQLDFLSRTEKLSRSSSQQELEAALAQAPELGYDRLAATARSDLQAEVAKLAANPDVGDKHPLVLQMRSLLNQPSDSREFLIGLTGLQDSLERLIAARRSAIGARQ